VYYRDVAETDYTLVVVHENSKQAEAAPEAKEEEKTKE